jgi:hypothetical protein
MDDRLWQQATATTNIDINTYGYFQLGLYEMPGPRTPRDHEPRPHNNGLNFKTSDFFRSQVTDRRRSFAFSQDEHSFTKAYQELGFVL